MKKIIALALLSFGFIAVTPVHAQEMPAGWQANAGAGVMYAPAYTGSDTYQLSVIPDLGVKYEDKFFASMRDGIGYNVINENGLRAGPVAKYDWGREDDGKGGLRIAGDRDNSLRGLGDVDGAPELGGFVVYDINPSLSAEAELRQAIGGHEGLVADAGVNYRTELGGFSVPVYLSAGPRMKLASEDYNEAYFGIDARQSAASGLAAYKPDGGIVSYGIGGSLTVPVTDRVSTTLFAGYDRLGDQAADSPLVENRGSANQAAMGVVAGYAF